MSSLVPTKIKGSLLRAWGQDAHDPGGDVIDRINKSPAGIEEDFKPKRIWPGVQEGDGGSEIPLETDYDCFIIYKLR